MLIKDIFINTRKQQINSYVLLIKSGGHKNKVLRYSHYQGEYHKTKISAGDNYEIKYYDAKEYVRETKEFVKNKNIDIYAFLYSLVFYKVIYSGRGKYTTEHQGIRKRQQFMLQAGCRVYHSYIIGSELVVCLRGIESLDWEMKFNTKQIKNQITSRQGNPNEATGDGRGNEILLLRLIIRLQEIEKQNEKFSLMKRLSNRTSTLTPDYCFYYYQCFKILKSTEKQIAQLNASPKKALKLIDAKKNELYLIKGFFSTQPQITTVVTKTKSSPVIKMSRDRLSTTTKMSKRVCEVELKTLDSEVDSFVSSLNYHHNQNLTIENQASIAMSLHRCAKNLAEAQNKTIYKTRPDYQSVINQIKMPISQTTHQPQTQP